MPSNAELANQMSALVNSWQTYIDQQITLDNGVFDYVTATPAGQPGPGYYPITMPNGITVWRPCIARIRADAMAFQTVALTGANSYTLNASHSGKMVNVYNNGGSTVNITVPPNMGVGLICTLCWMGTHTTMNLNAGSGVTLANDQGLWRPRARYSLCALFAPVNNTVIVQGSTRAPA